MSKNIVVVAHGKSEVAMWQTFRMRLRTNICIYSNKNGEEAITISGLPELFTGGEMSSEKEIYKRFGEDLDYRPRAREPLPGLKIFTVMDIDGNNRDRRPYMSGELLKNVPLGKYIVPIYNDNNLDDVMGEMGYSIDTGRPKASAYGDFARGVDMMEFYRSLLDNGNANMD